MNMQNTGEAKYTVHRLLRETQCNQVTLPGICVIKGTFSYYVKKKRYELTIKEWLAP